MTDYDDWRSYYTDEELAETPNERKARLAAAVSVRLIDGKCSRCGRELSKRGAHFHLKACK